MNQEPTLVDGGGPFDNWLALESMKNAGLAEIWSGIDDTLAATHRTLADDYARMSDKSKAPPVVDSTSGTSVPTLPKDGQQLRFPEIDTTD